jgi:MOSC domain-containing protein
VDSPAISPRLANIRLHPIKALDPVTVKEAHIGPSGGLELDRAWALYSTDGRWVNGKRTPAIHLIRAVYGPDLHSVTLSVPGDRRGIRAMEFAFPADFESAGDWFSVYFEQQIIIRYAREGFPDDTVAPGPTIISTASLQAVCGWFPGLTLEEARRRFRTTLEVDGVPAFWEDRLFSEDLRGMVRFRIGDVAFEGSNPCARCPVPSRDTYTGAAIDGFQKRFGDLRREHLPAWSPAERFDHFYRFATNTRVPSAEAGKIIRPRDALVLA